MAQASSTLAEAEPSAPAGTVRAWDLWTRAFHWLLVLLIVSAYCTRRFLDDPTLYWHRVNGYAVLALLLFRLLWGLFGSSTSRFAAFFPWPAPALRYGLGLIRGKSPHYLGHNPLGGALILVMLLAVVAQAAAGLFTSDDVLAQGPMVDHASDWLVGRMSAYHAKGFWIILALAAMHICANLFYQFVKKDRLITAMVTGVKPAIVYVDQQQAKFAPPLRAVACLAASIVIVVTVVWLASGNILR
jgi:cytochrome b